MFANCLCSGYFERGRGRVAGVSSARVASCLPASRAERHTMPPLTVPPSASGLSSVLMTQRQLTTLVLIQRWERKMKRYKNKN